MSLNFPIAGQGIFVFKQICPASTSVFQILNSEGTNGLNIQFTTNSVIVTEIQTLRHCYDAQNNPIYIQIQTKMNTKILRNFWNL